MATEFKVTPMLPGLSSSEFVPTPQGFDKNQVFSFQMLEGYLDTRAKAQKQLCIAVLGLIRHMFPKLKFLRYVDATDGCIRMVFKESEESEYGCLVDVHCPRENNSVRKARGEYAFEPGQCSMAYHEWNFFKARLTLEQLKEAIKQAKEDRGIP